MKYALLTEWNSAGVRHGVVFFLYFESQQRGLREFLRHFKSLRCPLARGSSRFLAQRNRSGGAVER